MAIYKNTPPIVTNGLVLALDAGNRQSYISGSTVWRDLSGNLNTGSLVNGPTFNSNNGGSIQFDGVDDFINLPNGIVSNLTICTISVWFYVRVIRPWARIYDFGTTAGVNMFFTCPANIAPLRPRFAINTGGGEQQLTSAITISTNTWYNYVVVLNGPSGSMYTNAVLDATNNSMTLNPSSLGNTTQNWFGRSQYISDPYLEGNISTFQIYNRALSAVEILQNYNATKIRFGLN